MPTGHLMQVTVACHQCDQPKRPLCPCPVCHAAPLAEPEMQAWRLSLHARHLARIKATPYAPAQPARDPRSLSPMAVTVTLDFELEHPSMTGATVLPFIPFDAAPLDPALEFDWDDEPRRRSA
jgi:hypothetical protein